VKHDAKPYQLPDVSDVLLGAWERYDGEDWAPLGDEADGWDPQTDLVVRRGAEADWARLKEQAGLEAGFPLAVTTSWAASTSQMRALIATVQVPSLGRVTVQGTIPGRRASGVLELTTTIAIVTDWSSAPAGVAQRAGSVFLTETCRVTLEGSGSLFPVAIIDFTHTGFHPDASWHLTSPHDLSAPFMGTFLLYINERDAELVRAITASRPGPAQRVLVQEVHHQVAMTMLELAVEAEQHENLMDSDWPAESAGDVLKSLRVAAGGHPPVDTADRRTWLAGVARRTANGRAFQ
jgi:hypothetical protein